MSRRYWSSDPSSYDDFLLPVAAMRCRGNLSDPLTEPRPADAREPSQAVFRGVGRITVIDHERLTLDQRIGDPAPIAAVVGVVPVVAERQVVPFWDDQRTPIVSRRTVCHTRRRGGFHKIIALPPKFVLLRIDIRLGMLHVLLAHDVAVADKCPVSHLDCVAGHTLQALDEILRHIAGVVEHYHVAALRIPKSR